MLLGILVFGLVGTAVELLLLGHDESLTQLVPLVLIATGIAVITWHMLLESTFKPPRTSHYDVCLRRGGCAGSRIALPGQRGFSEGDRSFHSQIGKYVGEKETERLWRFTTIQ
jgi:hypothetical protein